MTFAVKLSGFAYSGYPPTAVDMSPAYSGMLYSISNTYATLPGVISFYCSEQLKVVASANMIYCREAIEIDRARSFSK